MVFLKAIGLPDCVPATIGMLRLLFFHEMTKKHDGNARKKVGKVICNDESVMTSL
jgi:hypothetical protein